MGGLLLAQGGLALGCGHPLSSQAEELRGPSCACWRRGGLRRELLEAQRKVREGQDGHEAQRQEVAELRRNLAGSTRDAGPSALQQRMRAALKTKPWAAGQVGCAGPSPSPAPSLAPPSSFRLIPGTISIPRFWGIAQVGFPYYPQTKLRLCTFEVISFPAGRGVVVAGGTAAGPKGGGARPWPHLPASPWRPVCLLVHLSPPRVCSASLEGLAQGDKLGRWHGHLRAGGSQSHSRNQGQGQLYRVTQEVPPQDWGHLCPLIPPA